MLDKPADEAMRITADVVIAYIAGRPVEPGEIATLIRQIRAALQGEASAEPSAAPSAALSLASRPEQPSRETRSSEAPPVKEVVLASPRSRPPLSIEDSITDEYLISFEDGHRYRSLKRYLRSKYGMTPDEYRKKWGLPSDYPMVAPALARSRSLAAVEAGFGRSRKSDPTPVKLKPKSL